MLRDIRHSLQALPEATLSPKTHPRANRGTVRRDSRHYMRTLVLGQTVQISQQQRRSSAPVREFAYNVGCPSERFPYLLADEFWERELPREALEGYDGYREALHIPGF